MGKMVFKRESELLNFVLFERFVKIQWNLMVTALVFFNLELMLKLELKYDLIYKIDLLWWGCVWAGNGGEQTMGQWWREVDTGGKCGVGWLYKLSLSLLVPLIMMNPVKLKTKKFSCEFLLYILKIRWYTVWKNKIVSMQIM